MNCRAWFCSSVEERIIPAAAGANSLNFLLCFICQFIAVPSDFLILSSKERSVAVEFWMRVITCCWGMVRWFRSSSSDPEGQHGVVVLFGLGLFVWVFFLFLFFFFLSGCLVYCHLVTWCLSVAVGKLLCSCWNKMWGSCFCQPANIAMMSLTAIFGFVGRYQHPCHDHVMHTGTCLVVPRCGAGS